MRILVTGASGQLGYDVMTAGRRGAEEMIGTGRADPFLHLDLTDRQAVFTAVERVRPDAIIHCAAWTNVDGAEEQAEQCRAVNVDGTRNVAEAAIRANAKLLYISTDYVFDGSGERPWREDDPCGPLNIYGQSKLDGERLVRETLDRHFIVRSSWLYGVHGKNFVRTMLRLGKERDAVRVVDDQIGTPTYTADLAALVTAMVKSEHYGTYHAVNSGSYISWYEFTREIFALAGIRCEVLPVSSEDYGAKAIRPHNSRLDTGKLCAVFAPLPDWHDALKRYLKDGSD